MHPFIVLCGSRHRLLPNSRPARTVDRSQTISITVSVRSKIPLNELEKVVLTENAKPVRERNFPACPFCAEQYGAHPEDLTAVEHHAARHYPHVARRSTAERIVQLRGALGDMLHSFLAQLRLYHHALGAYRDGSGQNLIPEHLNSIVTGIFDLHMYTLRCFRPRASSDATAPIGNNGYPAPFFAVRHNFPTDHQGFALDGSGQNVALIELGGGYDSSDLQTYFSKIGQPAPNVSNASVGAANFPESNVSADGEVMMDIEIAASVAPRANIVVYGPESRRAVAPKALTRLKGKIREVTRQATGIRIETTVKRLTTYMVVWHGYFGFCETPEVLIGLVCWVRLGLRCTLKRQWKNPRRHRAVLLQLGAGPRLAANMSGSGRSPWYLARSQAFSVGVSNAHFCPLGLPSLFGNRGGLVQRMTCTACNSPSAEIP